MQFARLKPRAHNPRVHKLQSYTVFGIKFLEARGWYEVDDDVAAYLRTVKQVQDGPDAAFSADGFDVVDSLEAAKALDAQEKARVERALAEQAYKTSAPQTTSARRAASPTKDSGEPSRRKGASFDDMDDTFPEDGQPLETRTTAPSVILDGAVGEDDDADEEAPPPPATKSKPPARGKR